MSSPRRWCRRSMVLPFTQFLSLVRSLACSRERERTNVSRLCNQVKVAQAPRRAARGTGDDDDVDSRTATPSTVVLRRHLRHPSDRPDTILLHDRLSRVLSSYRFTLRRVIPLCPTYPRWSTFWPVFHGFDRRPGFEMKNIVFFLLYIFSSSFFYSNIKLKGQNS